jgi:hypothetical protein
LARHGHTSFQSEFVYLSDTMRELGSNQELIGNLIAGDPYLSFVWEICQASFDELDTRFEAPTGSTLEAAPVGVGNLDLLSDSDFKEIGFNVDDVALWERFDDAVETFLGGIVGVPMFDPNAGFRLRSADTDRIETFLRELESLHDVVPLARGYRAITLLYFGCSMRSKSVFGTVNVRKQDLLREGVAEFIQNPEAVWEVVAVFGYLHAESGAWEKISDVLLDYANWVATESTPSDTISDYNPIERLLANTQRSGYSRRSDR